MIESSDKEYRVLVREIDEWLASGKLWRTHDLLTRCRAMIESQATENASLRADHDSMLADLSALLLALGMGDHARPESPHAVMRSAIYIAARDHALLAEAERKLNTPEIEDFVVAVSREAAHQIARWGYAHDRSKSAENWFWLVGYLAGKALRSAITGDRDKALHHTISSAAALANWHAAIKGDTTGACIGQDDDLRKDNPIDARAADAARQSAQAAEGGKT